MKKPTVKTIPELQTAIFADPLAHATREELIERLTKGKLHGEAAAQTVYLAYLRGGGSPVIVELAELLTDELQNRGAAYRPEYAPPILRLVADGREPVSLRSEGGQLLFDCSGVSITIRRTVRIASLADFVTPFVDDGEDWLFWSSAYRPLAIREARNRFRDDEAAEGKAIEALLKAAKAFSGWGNFAALAKAFIRNALDNYRRSKGKRSRSKHQYVSDMADSADTSDNFAAVDMEDLLSILSAKDRDIFERHHLRDESVASIARNLGASVSTVNRSLAQSRKRLAQEIS